MKAQARAWWGLRSTREQRLLLAMAALAVITLAWLAIVRPLDDGLADARARHARAVIDLATARGQAERIVDLEKGRTAATTAPLASVLSMRLREAGFADARVVPDDSGRATVAIDAARARALFGLVADLERRDGLIVERFGARANGDATLAIEVVMRERGR